MPGEFEGLEAWGEDGVAGADTSRVSFLGDVLVHSHLFHGSHLWDTGFDVAGTFGGLENVDGLEAVAVPEPSAAAIAAFACLGLWRFRRRKV
ncbi:MAG: hypothetical protein ACKV19_02315 [Verrucomicrobiales bacterium]